jgi:hypothetical protein
VERRIWKFHLSFDSAGADNPKCSANLDRVIKERRLASTWFSMEHKDATESSERGNFQPVEDLPFSLTAEQLRPGEPLAQTRGQNLCHLTRLWHRGCWSAPDRPPWAAD